MEDIFYCGNGDFSEAEEKKIKAFVPECKKIWRIKTRQEFVDTLGPGWASYYRNDEGAWNTEGRMEWLLGKPLHEVLSNNEDREHWNGMEKVSGQTSFNRQTKFKVLDNETAPDDDDPWVIWPYYDIVYATPV